jgi:uncharacterized protein YijF (DUF1287 family)
VCTDEVIRAYRAVGIDLQKEVHIDMLNHLPLIRENGAIVRVLPNWRLPTPTSIIVAFRT